MLRVYQHTIIERIESTPNRLILGILPTGGGKTICISEIFNRHGGKGVAIAHRRELISQIRAACHPDVRIVSIDKLLRDPSLIEGAEIIQIDEAHHVLEDNKWSKALLPKIPIIGWTATPTRTDKRKLPFEVWIQGPTPAELVAAGYLVPVEVYAPPSGFDRSAVKRGASGEFSQRSLIAETRRAPIVGNIVEHYLRIAPGARGVTFCVDVEAAREQTQAFLRRGVPAAMLEAGSKEKERERVIADYRRGDIKQVCNVDILGEGVDIPGIEVVSMGRATESRGLCWQQIGRCRRPARGKRAGILLDHVGNVLKHGLPDSFSLWDKETGKPRPVGGAGELPVRQCYGHGCWRVFEGWSPRCPYCGWQPEREAVERPGEVEGDLALYSPALLAQLTKDAATAVAGPPGRPPRTPRERVMWNHMKARREAQLRLRAAMDEWAVRRGGVSSEAYREFYMTFGIDAASARGLSGPDATALTERLTGLWI